MELAIKSVFCSPIYVCHLHYASKLIRPVIMPEPRQVEYWGVQTSIILSCKYQLNTGYPLSELKRDLFTAF